MRIWHAWNKLLDGVTRWSFDPWATPTVIFLEQTLNLTLEKQSVNDIDAIIMHMKRWIIYLYLHKFCIKLILRASNVRLKFTKDNAFYSRASVYSSPLQFRNQQIKTQTTYYSINHRRTLKVYYIPMSNMATVYLNSVLLEKRQDVLYKFIANLH